MSRIKKGDNDDLFDKAGKLKGSDGYPNEGDLWMESDEEAKVKEEDAKISKEKHDKDKKRNRNR